MKESSNPHGLGYNFTGERASRAERLLARLRVDNAARRPCPYCQLAISPAGFERHVALCAEVEA